MPEYSNLQDTAYYVFDTRVFRQRIRHVRQLLGPDMALAYAIGGLLPGGVPHL